MVWLYSQETYNPGDLQVQIDNTQPEVNFSVVSNASSPLTLDNLNALNNLGGAYVYLTSTVSLADNPTYLNGVKPNSVGETVGAKSCTIIINDHGGSSTVGKSQLVIVRRFRELMLLKTCIFCTFTTIIEGMSSLGMNLGIMSAIGSIT